MDAVRPYVDGGSVVCCRVEGQQHPPSQPASQDTQLTMVMRLCTLVVMVVVLMACWCTDCVAGQTSNYCSFTSRHTLCRTPGLGERCGQEVQGRGVGAREAAAITSLHNQLRSRVAMGLEGRGAPGPQPSASNMKLMVWDTELATLAQAHADQCTFEHECNDCRRVGRFAVGQNLFISFQSNFDRRVQWGRAIKAWYDEVQDFPNDNIMQFQFSAPVGHYTQLMWWSSDKIGCGFTMYREDGWWKKLYTCNYGPAGNILFSQMYRQGPPCSACPRGYTCSLNYPGLCDTTTPPTPDSPTTATDTTTSVPSITQQQQPQQQQPKDSVTDNTNTDTTTTTTTTTTTPPTTLDTSTIATTTTTTTTTTTPSTTQASSLQGPTSSSSSRLTSNQVSLGRQPVGGNDAEDNDTEMFVPFSGQQPKSTDLLPFLDRAGMNTQVIRTASLSNVQGIIRALPQNTRPIVLFRTTTGQLTELDPSTLQPRGRFGRSTTTRGPRTNALTQALLVCDLDVSPCEVTPVGGNWTVGNSDSEGRYVEVVLSPGEGAQAVVEQLVTKPPTGAACIALSHRRSLLPGAFNDTSLPQLQIAVMPLGSDVTRRAVLGAPGMWEMSRVTFRDLTTSFLVAVTVGPTSHPAAVALDAIMVTDGQCCRSGGC
ncbi:hypothetical protein Pmani_035743 [Petrolisthes manimaculis]|uniref:SCP domain-containing protein n=1 Tax=Petrolisthes manimaculis TaxID=1843537 RepID=A0AAE1NLQ7_9EUCA|nr:hypothetical protein Pmani_035743 [Petrolisthes manimaculis]